MSNELAVARSTRLGRLLAGAQGYAVSSTTGQRLGRIIWLTYDLDDPSPAGLRVQPDGRPGLFSTESWEIPFEWVVSVLPARLEVVTGPGGRAPARHRP